MLLKKLYKSNLVVKYLPNIHRDQSLAHTGTHMLTLMHTHLPPTHTHAHRLTHIHPYKKQAAHLHPSPTGVPLKSKWVNILQVMEKDTLAHRKMGEPFLCMCKAKVMVCITEKAQVIKRNWNSSNCVSGWVTRHSNSISFGKQIGSSRNIYWWGYF